MSAVKGADGPVFAGIDIGGTSIKWMIVDEAGTILTQGSEPTRCEAWPSRWATSAPGWLMPIRDWWVSD